MNNSIEDYNFVIASRFRTKILLALSKSKSLNQKSELKLKSPSEISKETGTYIGIVTKTLMELRNRGLVKCITPHKKKGRLYRLTKKGEKLSDMIKSHFGSGKPWVLASLLIEELKPPLPEEEKETPLEKILKYSGIRRKMKDMLLKESESLIKIFSENIVGLEEELIDTLTNILKHRHLEIKPRTELKRGDIVFPIDILFKDSRGRTTAIECEIAPFYRHWINYFTKAITYLHSLKKLTEIDEAYLATYKYLIDEEDLKQLVKVLREFDVGLILVDRRRISRIIPKEKKKLWNSIVQR